MWRCRLDFKCVNFKHNLGDDILSIQLKCLWNIELNPYDIFDSKSKYVQVMPASQFMKQCWLRYMYVLPYE